MTQERAKQMLPFVQAVADGKELQWQSDPETWIPARSDWDYTADLSRIRIKPEPREFWLGIHQPCEQTCCCQLSKYSQGNKPDTCCGDEFIKVREVLE